MLSLLSASQGLTVGTAARGLTRAQAPQMGIGLIYSTTTGMQMLASSLAIAVVGWPLVPSLRGPCS